MKEFRCRYGKFNFVTRLNFLVNSEKVANEDIVEIRQKFVTQPNWHFSLLILSSFFPVLIFAVWAIYGGLQKSQILRDDSQNQA